MNSTKNGRLNTRRITRTFHLAPTTRAIRAALAISMTLLAFGVSATALAGTCVTDTTANTATCDGDFTSLPGGNFSPVADLTLILGDSAPTSVTPAAGTVGVEASWGGNVGVISSADITTVGADGVHEYGSTSASLTNNGAITTNVTSPGAKAVDISAYGDVTVVNTGPILAYSTGANDVTAVGVYSSHGNVSFDNQATGTITATAQDGNAIAVVASGYGAYGATLVYNEGAITATSVNGAAIGSLVYTGFLAIARNQGSITATSTNGQALGEAIFGGAYGYAINYGAITAISGSDSAVGVEAYGTRIGGVINHGSITATSTGGAATGVLAQAGGIATALVTNSGSISATTSYGQAAGVIASGSNGYAKVTNSGAITATENGKGNAIGIGAYSQYGSYVTNSGTVSAITTSATYGGTATGISAVTNDTSAFYGTASVTNSGSVTATSDTTSASYPGAATGVLVSTQRGSANAINSSTGSIVATARYHNDAIGVTASSGFEGDAYVYNAGSISASTQVAHATGIIAQSHYGTTTVVNNGDINAVTTGQIRTNKYATGQRDYAEGIVASSGAGVASGTTSVTNSGGITAQGSFFAEGIEAAARYGAVSVTNHTTGVITVTGDQFAIGIGTGHNNYYARTGEIEDNYTHSAVIDNAGSINVTATGNPDHCGSTYCQFLFSGAVGIGVFLTYGNDITVTNSGNIAVSVGGTSYLSSATGIQAITDHGDVTVNNSGHIAVSATAAQFNYGIRAYTLGGAVSIDNSGSIAMSTIPGYTTNEMFGISASTGINNTGGSSGPGGGISIVNSGDINISGGIVYGIDARSHIVNGDTVAITNSGNITAYGSRATFGILAETYDSSSTAMTIYNSGILAATSARSVAGILANMDGNGATLITNSGDLSAAGGFDATGVVAQFGSYALIDGAATIDNSGSISASVDKKIALPSNYGTKIQAEGVYGRTTYGNVTVANTGLITSNILSEYAGAAGPAGVANSTGIATINQTYSGRNKATIGDTTITNGETGSITSTAEFALGSGAAVASGIYAHQFATSLTFNGNGGRGYVSAASGITVTNSGAISATALVDAAASGSATATGILTVNQLAGFATVTNYGSVLATATNSGAIVATDPTSGMANATGISVFAPTATVALNAGGYVGAIATGASGSATGLSVTGSDLTATGLAVADTVTAGNAGTISATFHGAGGKAYGANITSSGDLSFTNSGQIFANANGNAVGISLNTPTNVTLINSGLISALSTDGNSIAVQAGDSTNTIENTGTISGAIVSGAGSDILTNSAGGTWFALGTGTDFGAGDDTISNAGTIHLNNSAITLGSFDTLGNSFTNSGTVTALGSNTIDMGANNPNPFTNTGTVDMRNGATGDAMSLIGNWAGSGQLGLDVSGLHGTSDMLNIVGNVAAGSVTAVNVNLIDLPKTATGSVPVVTVTGDSTAGSFVLGDVHFDTAKSFLVVQGVDLTSSIDTTNAKPDVFSVGFAVSGVTNSGALAASIVPGVESLLNSEVGTWRQRMGVMTPVARGSVGLWTRAFNDSGTVNPGHVAGNFGQGGDFSFDQTNSGEEVGADFGITPNFSAGLMLGNAQGSQHLDGGGVGSNKITGRTRGAYATWMAGGGFYLDASYRSMSFDARLDAQAGESRTTGKADAFNVELGQSWAFGNGFKLVPQVQYTHTTVNKADTLSGELAGFTPEGGTSSRGRAGLTLSDDITSGSTVWTPYVSGSAVHEFDGQNDFTIDDTFTGTTDTKGTSALVEGGLSVKTGKLEVFGGANWQDGGAMKSFAGGQVGLRYSW